MLTLITMYYVCKTERTWQVLIPFNNRNGVHHLIICLVNNKIVK